MLSFFKKIFAVILWSKIFYFIVLKHYCFTFVISSTVFKTLFPFLSEAVVQSYSVKKEFLEISKNSEENICTRVFFLIRLQASGAGVSCEFCEISKNIFSYRTPSVVASVIWVFLKMFPLVAGNMLTHFMPRISFYTPGKHQKTCGYLKFSGV